MAGGDICQNDKVCGSVHCGGTTGTLYCDHLLSQGADTRQASVCDSRCEKPAIVPVVVEVLIMELLFELLREAGIRLPSQLGNTIGVVGGLIVGQSAVEAGIVSTMVVIVVALTAIASFAIPNEAFASVFRLLKFVIIITSALYGILGFILAMLVLVFHLASWTALACRICPLS